MLAEENLEAKQIVVVEDNYLNMKLFRDLLMYEGYRVLEVSDGFKAFDIIRKAAPDLVLMDVQLHGISGLDIVRRMKNDAELKSVPVVAVTAFTLQDDNDKILDAGCDDCLSKPISVDAFLKMVNRFLVEA